MGSGKALLEVTGRISAVSPVILVVTRESLYLNKIK